MQMMSMALCPARLTASADDAVNQELAVFPAKGYCVDGSQNDEAQQAAGKKLVEYLTIERAQDMSDALSHRSSVQERRRNRSKPAGKRYSGLCC